MEVGSGKKEIEKHLLGSKLQIFSSGVYVIIGDIRHEQKGFFLKLIKT